MSERGRGRGRGGGGTDRGRGGGADRGGRGSGRGAPRGGPPSSFGRGAGPGGGDGGRGGFGDGSRGRGAPTDAGRGRGIPTDRGRGSQRGDRGRGRGGPPVGGPRPQTGVGQPQDTDYNNYTVSISPQVEAEGVKRPKFGRVGVPYKVLVNAFKCDVPQGTIHHYDTIPGDKVLPQKFTIKIITAMQEQNPEIFVQKGSYDGRANLYSTMVYNLGPNHEHEFQVQFEGHTIRVRIKKAAATYEPETLNRYIQGLQSHNEDILTVLNACNVAIRMKPIQENPFNARSFFTQIETLNLGKGVELWRGYFQSVRPGIGKMFINVDISSGAFFKAGPLIELCRDFLGEGRNANPNTFLSTQSLSGRNQRKRNDLLKFLRNLAVRTTREGQTKVRGIKDLSTQNASDHMFTGDNGPTTVQAFFSMAGRPLQYPGILSVKLGSKAFVPIELCTVVEGQLMRKQIPQALMANVVSSEFATKHPAARLQSIRAGFQVFQYGTSSYLQDFGIANVSVAPMEVQGRLLQPPDLQYKGSTKQVRNGAWNMMGLKLYRPTVIKGCVVLIFDSRFSGPAEDRMKAELYEQTVALGIEGMPTDPLVERPDPNRPMTESFRTAAMKHAKLKGNPPNLLLCVLPEFGNEDIYTRIKNAGDIVIGVATQCVQSKKLYKGGPQYWANVCLKINVKLGGINAVPKLDSLKNLYDVKVPTLIIGADVQHPGPGSNDRPSYAAVTGSVDEMMTKYVAISKPQAPRVEMIQELDVMVYNIIQQYQRYRTNIEKRPPNPLRIIFYRDGISEGQFKECKEFEIKKIKDALKKAKITPMPKLTFIVVGKRHHIRFFPADGNGDGKTGNVPAGFVLDRDICSPVEYDFYLQSHGGLKGTSRSAHYNVLLDENGFEPDDLQRLSFALCHVYARATRSVSIVPPVYYADIVCERARHHFRPEFDLTEDRTQTGTGTSAERRLETVRNEWRPIHAATGQTMYFQ